MIGQYPDCMTYFAMNPPHIKISSTILQIKLKYANIITSIFTVYSYQGRTGKDDKDGFFVGWVWFYFS